MSHSKTTTRAFAASIVCVAAGATMAAAAIFHLPVLGVGGTAAANATTAAATTPTAAPRARHPKAIKIVRTRYVNDIVHRPAPTATAAGATAAAPPMSPLVPAPPAFVTVPSTESEGTTSTTEARPPEVSDDHGDDAEPEHEIEHNNPGATSTTTTQPGTHDDATDG